MRDERVREKYDDYDHHRNRDNDSERRNGFDMAPPVASMPSGAAVAEQLPFIPQTMQGMVQNIFPFGATQLGALPMMPVEAMTQQATRHACRLYVGGLPPLANEQVFQLSFAGSRIL